MKPFLNPFAPALTLAAFVALLIAMPFGRFYSGDGELWTIFGGVALLAMFAYGASKWPALNQLGTSFRQWLKSALIVALSVTGILAAATSASSIANQYRNPHYRAYDIFLVTNNQPDEILEVPRAGQDASTMLATLAVTFAFLFLAAIVGIAIGVSEDAANRWVPLIVGIAVAGLLLGFAYAQAYWGYAETEGMATPSSSVVWIMLGSGALVIACTAIAAIARTPRFVK
ncbi:hypothetical protein CGLAU_02505 [Corynebacterium glaucum]|uniref:Uncharacterized protein n=1 Tax=Corynebacterium glaucum TaxID=187491 RepID=A0A1Q2HUF9_9CORY|nr:hypothetical protein [Corynebacterium glaucum]AQQ14486.1 hypothetical protein CGLAU_02505 [Corynebacterium glaucum]